MTKATQPRCPECGSKNIRSVESVLVSNLITGWDVNSITGLFEPADFAGGDVCWDSSEFVKYECGDCFHPLAAADLSTDREDEDDDDDPTDSAFDHIMRYNNRLNELEIAPNGDDYNNLLDLLAGGEYRDPSKVSR